MFVCKLTKQQTISIVVRAAERGMLGNLFPDRPGDVGERSSGVHVQVSETLFRYDK